MTRPRLSTGVWSNLLFLFLIILIPECLLAGGSSDLAEGVYGHIEDEVGSPVNEVDITMFDGFTSHTAKTDISGEYKIPEFSVSPGLYGVIFFTREGFLPVAVNIKAGEIRVVEYSTVMKRTDASDTGFVIGTVYQPLRGGKIQFQAGIYGFGENRRVWLEKGEKVIEKKTDLEGHFLFEVPPGRYKLSGEGVRERIEVDVVGRKTVIRNLRSGIVLVD